MNLFFYDLKNGLFELCLFCGGYFPLHKVKYLTELAIGKPLEGDYI